MRSRTKPVIDAPRRRRRLLVVDVLAALTRLPRHGPDRRLADGWYCAYYHG